MSAYTKIIGTGSFLPGKPVTNHDLTLRLAQKGLETSDEWIVSRSGISARHYADLGVLSSDLATEAALRALQMAGLAPNDIDLIILATSTPDFLGGFPSTACVVQRKLGIDNECAALDVQAVCSGFVYAASIMGVTGARASVSSGAENLVSRIREVTQTPVAVGLGVSNRAQAREVASYADGVIVGSAFVKAILDAPSIDQGLVAVRELAAELALGVRGQ